MPKKRHRKCAGCTHPTMCGMLGCAAAEARDWKRYELRLQADQKAQARALRIASTAAEEVVRTEGEPTGVSDHFTFAQCQVDDYRRDCIDHLVWQGRAASHVDKDGLVLVMLGDYTVGGGA